MTQLTIRGVESSLHTLLKQKAKQKNMSMNRYVLEIIRKEVLGGKKTPQRYTDLSHFYGRWDEETAAEFDEYLAETHEIDMDMWT